MGPAPRDLHVFLPNRFACGWGAGPECRSADRGTLKPRSARAPRPVTLNAGLAAGRDPSRHSP